MSQNQSMTNVAAIKRIDPPQNNPQIVASASMPYVIVQDKEPSKSHSH